MQDAGGFIQSVFNIDRKKDLHPLRISSIGTRVAFRNQNPMYPNLLKFEDLKENLVFESICDAPKGHRKWNYGLGKAINSRKPLISSFSLEMEGVFAPPDLNIDKGHSMT